MLHDDESKKIYEAMIHYRITRKKIYHPKYFELDQYYPPDIIKLENIERFIDGDTVFRLKYLLNNKIG